VSAFYTQGDPTGAGAGAGATIGVGVLGYAFMGKAHANAYKTLAYMTWPPPLVPELVAMAGRNEEAVAEAARRYGFAGHVTDWRALVQDDRIGLFDNSGPNDLHAEPTIAAAEAGKHVICEKPLGRTADESYEIWQRVAATGVKHMCAFNYRFVPAVRLARELLEAGELGDVYQVTTRRQGPFPARIADVGVVKDLGTHDIDLTAWVTQQSYTSVSARTAYKSGREHEDLVAVVGSLSGGTVASHLVNWLSPLKERVTIITGERGAFVADTLTADLTFYANGEVATAWDDIANFRGVSEGDVVRYAIAKPEPLRVEHEQFRDAVLGKDDADIVTLEQGLTTVAVAEACIESAATGRTVDVSGA
jgi:predicted dehydrogenase